MYDYREYFIAIAAIFLALALGILIGVSFGDNFLVSNQREIIELMEQELSRRKTLLNEKEQTLERWEQLKPLIWRSYKEAMPGKLIAVIARDESRAIEIRALLENAGAEVEFQAAEEVMALTSAKNNWQPEEISASRKPDCYVLLLEGIQSDPSEQQILELWHLLHHKDFRVIAAYPRVEADLPVIPAEQGQLSIVDNIDTFWGQVALLEMVVHGARGDYGISPQRQGLLPLPAGMP